MVRFALTAALIVLAVHVPYARQADLSDPASAVRRGWAILTSTLESGSVPEQAAAVRALVTNDTPRAIDLLDRILRNTSHPLRGSLIGMMPSPQSMLPLLAEAVRDRDLEVRRSAIQQLGRIKDPRALDLLQDVILQNDAETVDYAVGSAELQGSAAFGVLLHVLDTGGERSRDSAARTLNVLIDGSLRPRSAENLAALGVLRPERVLTKALGDGNANVRGFAALILARRGDAAAAEQLIRMVEAPDPRAGTIASRHHAMAALNMLGRPGYVAPLTAALASSDERVRLDAAHAMRSFAHPSLRDALNAVWRSGPFSDVRSWAFESLLAIDPDDLALLRAGLVDSDAGIQFKAAERLLARGHDPASIGVLERLVAETGVRVVPLSILSTKGDPVRIAALARSLLPRSADELALMRGTFNSYDPGRWLAVVFTLETLKDREAVPALASLLDWGADPELSYRVVRALVAINDEESRRILVRALDSPRSAARIAAAGGVLSVFPPAR
jgi:HEAT repeat protein